MTHHVFTRRALYDLVWAEAMVKVAKRLGVSDVGLAKACRRADIPIPGRGYWSRLQYGKPTSKPPLPDRPDIRQVVLAPVKPRSKPAAPVLATPPPDVRVAAALHNPHPIVRAWMDNHGRAKRDAKRGGWSVTPPGFEGPQAQRRLRLYSSLFKALAAGGFKLEAGYGPEQWLKATKNGEVQEFRIYERTRIERRPATADELRWHPGRHTVRANVPAGDLVLKFRGGPHYDQDMRDANGPLEEQLGAAVAMLERGVDSLIDRRRAQEESRRQWEVAQERRRRREVQLAAQDKRRERLFAEAERWRAAGALRGMVAAAAETSERAADPAFAAWRAWALEEANAADPVTSGRLDLAGLPPLDADLQG